MDYPLVYILILNYNRYQDTIECVDSIKAVNYKNYKLLIVDNSSTDNSYERLIKYYPEYEILKTDSNLGYTGGINFGLNILLSRNSEYILILNNDTVVDKNFLCELVKGFNKQGNIGAACGTILCEHNRNEIWYAGGKIHKYRGLASHNYKGEFFSGKFKKLGCQKTEFITGCMLFLKTSVLRKVGNEDNRFFMYLDDIEFSIRIRKNGYELFYIPNSIIYHKVIGEKESPFKLYYSVRNRLLLINSSFVNPGKTISKIYFMTVILLKLFVWRFTNKRFFQSAKAGLFDYYKRNFGMGRGLQYLGKY
ncbi:MAG: glycosyltransferase family 2 protein [Melioribacteraceae bacterium]|nr:MAG: glycosyltransferase family 2 protein [Melioribacteraceae bacterium]